MTGAEMMMAWGKVLTFGLTFPIVGFVMFGFLGLIIGGILGLMLSGKPLQALAEDAKRKQEEKELHD